MRPRAGARDAGGGPGGAGAGRGGAVAGDAHDPDHHVHGAGERARALGIWSAALASGGATGALLGGILTDTLSWRWIFLVNVPVGVAGIVAARAVLAERRGEGTRSLDVAGALLVTGSLTALVYGLVRTDVVGWGSPQTAAALVVAAVLMAAFLFVETRVAASPLVPLPLLRTPALAGANLAMLCVGGSMFAMWYFTSLYLQGVLGESPLRGGPGVPAGVAGGHRGGPGGRPPACRGSAPGGCWWSRRS